MHIRVAIIHDWLLGMRGGERCLEVIGKLFPQADLYTLFYRPEEISKTINSHSISVSSLQLFPGVEHYYRYLLPIYSLGTRSLSRTLFQSACLDKYDLVISVSHCVAKNVRVPKGTLHICYCLTPMRYIWDQYEAYFDGHCLERLIRAFLPMLRRWDVSSSEQVNHFYAISQFVRTRIREVYHREADVIYPPVRTDWIIPRNKGEKGEGFLCVNALVPYKNVELIIRSFNRLPYTLTVVGSGPLERRLRRLAGPNIRFLGSVPDMLLGKLYRQARALVFAAVEDFGMTPVEMQAAGRPVICYAHGGVLETVVTGGANPSGVYFSELTEEALIAAVEEFIVREDEFGVDNCISQARRFSVERFCAELRQVLHGIGISLADMEPRKMASG